MKRIFTTTLILAGLLALGAFTALACPMIFVINFSGQFGLMDLATGVFLPVGKGLENTPDGIAGAPGGPFYTVDGATGHLIRIGLNGSISDVGDTHTGPNIGPKGVSLVGALVDGTVYALDFSNTLYRVNTETGALLDGRAIPLPDQEHDYSGNMMTSLNGDGSHLYYTLEIIDGPRKTGPTIFTIDPVKATVTSRSLKSVRGAIGSGWINGSLYLFNAFGRIYRVDPSTGDAEVVSIYDSGIGPQDPPLTGVFGAVGTIEPYTNRRVAPETRLDPAVQENHAWPARHWPRAIRSK